MAAYNSNKMLAGTQPKMLPSAGGVNVLATASLTTALALNDTINMLQLAADASDPQGSGPTIIGMVLDCDKLDSNGTPTITLSVGDSVSATRYFNASTIAQTLPRPRCEAEPAASQTWPSFSSWSPSRTQTRVSS